MSSSPRSPVIMQSPSESSPSSSTNIPSQLVNNLTTPEGMMLAGSLAAMGVFSMVKGGTKKKNQLASSRFGGIKEKAAARKSALEQIEAKNHNEVALYLGRPDSNSNPLFIPDAQRGIGILGGSGSGKTITAILQMIYSAIDQDLPAIVYDYKYPTLTKRFVGHAAKRGYKVKIFAPGYEESEVCNPVEFLEPDDEGSDAMMAEQEAVTINRNFKKASQSKGDDPFFSSAGDQSVQSILMLARRTQYPDLMMCQAILSLTDLPARLMANRKSINAWVYANFGMMMSSAKSEKTVAGIIATANRLFTTFMKAKVLSAFCGKTTIPTDLKGKQILVLGLDREKRDVLAPLLAAILELIVNRNVTRERKDPLCLFLDEVPTLYLPRLKDWLSQNREDGLCTIWGAQHLVQLEGTYGKEASREIFGNSATKFIFNPQEYESAKLVSDYLDDVEVQKKQMSRSHGKGGASTNISDADRTKRLMSPGEILRLPKGKCILINPGYENQGEAYIPIVEKIKLSWAYLALKLKSESMWKPIRQKLIERSSQSPITQKDLEKRYDLSEQLYPLLQEKGQQPPSNDGAYRVNLSEKSSFDVEQLKKLAGFW